MSVCDFPTFCTFLWQMVWFDGKTQWCFVSKKIWPRWVKTVIEKNFAALFESVYLGALHLCWFLAVVCWFIHHVIYLKLRKSSVTNKMTPSCFHSKWQLWPFWVKIVRRQRKVKKILTLKGVISKFKKFIFLFGGVDHKWLQIIGAPPPEAADVDRRQGKDYTSSGFTERCKVCIILAPKISYYCTLIKKKSSDSFKICFLFINTM